MRRPAIVGVMITFGVIACFNAPEANSASLGSIRGFVKDLQGKPLAGAAVLVLLETEKPEPEKVIKRSSTDEEGKFTASGIQPGKYRVKAFASGYRPVEVAALIKPNAVTVFDSILLRRIGTLAEETSLNADPKYAARSARGTIFHVDEQTSDPLDAQAASSAQQKNTNIDIHGFVNAFGQVSSFPSLAQGSDHNSFLGTNFALTQQLPIIKSLVVSGQLGIGNGAPQRFQALTKSDAGERNQVSVALGYGRFTISRRGEGVPIGQVSLSARDTWQVSGPVLVVYGLEFAHFIEGSSGTSVVPRFGIAFDARSKTRFFAGITPGSSEDQQTSVDLESGEIIFPESKPVGLSNTAGKTNAPILDRSYRFQFGSEQILPDGSSVQMMAFFDTISGHGVGLLAIPLDGPGDNSFYRTQEQSGRARGVRFIYHKQISKVIDTTAGYAVGEGQSLDPRGITDPGSLFRNGRFQIVSAKVDANFVRSGTKISAVLRLASGGAVLAIDPFQGEISTYDPNISIIFTQQLPNPGIPGQLTAIVDVRNLLDQQCSVSDERQRLIASRFHRLVRVGVSLRF